MSAVRGGRADFPMKYSGKYFSVLGDSISTFEGYNPADYAVFYDRDRKLGSGIITAEDAK